MKVKFKTLDERLFEINQFLGSNPPMTTREAGEFFKLTAQAIFLLAGVGITGFTLVEKVLPHLGLAAGFETILAKFTMIFTTLLMFMPGALRLEGDFRYVFQRKWLHNKLVLEACMLTLKEEDLAKASARSIQLFARAEVIAENPHLDATLIEVEEMEGDAADKVMDLADKWKAAAAQKDFIGEGKARAAITEIVSADQKEALAAFLARQAQKKENDKE